MTGWLLDTNVLSELRRARPNQRVADFVSGRPLDLLHVSVVTFAEIRFGIELVKDAARRMELNNWLDQKLRPMFEGRVTHRFARHHRISDGKRARSESVDHEARRDREFVGKLAPRQPSQSKREQG